MKQSIKIFKALSNETRLQMYRLLLESDLCVGQLTNVLNMKQSRISHSLRILRNAGLVDTLRDGKRVIYSPHKSMAENWIAREVKNTIKIPAEDLEKMQYCKTDNIPTKNSIFSIAPMGTVEG